MFVPAGAFGGRSPERRASEMLNAMITYVSAWIVIGQLENVAPRRSLAGEDANERNESNDEAQRVTTSHDFLLDYLESNPVRYGDSWLTELTKVNPTLGERIGTVRVAYASDDFEWKNVEKLCVKSMVVGNETAMREWIKGATTAVTDAST